MATAAALQALTTIIGGCCSVAMRCLLYTRIVNQQSRNANMNDRHHHSSYFDLQTMSQHADEHVQESDYDDEDWRAIDSGSSDEGDDAFQRRKRRKHKDIYGVFWEEEDNNTKQKKRRFQRDDSKPSNSSEDLQFVRGTRPDANPVEPESTDDKLLATDVPVPLQGTQPDEDEFDAEEEKRKKQANEQFLALLAKGRDKKARQTTMAGPRNGKSTQPKQSAMLHDNASATQNGATYGLGLKPKETPRHEPTAGLGYREHTSDESLTAQRGLGFSNQQGIGAKSFPSTFGRQTVVVPKVAKPDPNIGQWEKHEKKGIGSKLLAKMGYKGSGGLRSDSIAAPIKVKLRPANLGLGFGNFKEVSSKKAPKPHPVDEAVSAQTSMGLLSALPTAKDILKHTARRRRKNAQMPKVVPYSEILKRSKETTGSMQIIDMTGGSMAKDKSGDGEVALADELLFNVSFVLNTYENRLQSASTFEQSFQRQQNSFQNDLTSLQNQASMLLEREAKLLQVQQLLKDVESTSSSGYFATRLRKTQTIIEEISSLFSDEEVKDLQVFETLVPAILGPVVRRELDLWSPTSPLPNETTVRLLLLQNKEGSMWDLTRKALLTEQIIPSLKQRFFSSRWDPMDENHSGLELVELLQRILKEYTSSENEIAAAASSESMFQGDGSVAQPVLLNLFQELLVDGSISDNLNTAIQRWKAGDCKRLDLWVLPWLPFLSKGNIPILVSECKRQIKAHINFLNKTVTENTQFVEKALASLGPWTGVLRSQTLQSMTKEVVTPRLARLLAKFPFSPDSADERIVGIPFTLHACDLIDDRTLLSLIEGELLPNMARSSLSWTIHEKAKKYALWKTLVFNSNIRDLLTRDDGVCRGFYAILLADHFIPTNYHAVYARRKLQAQEKNEEEWIRQEDKSETVEARVNLANQTATFREVVEEFARSHDLLLIPHRSKRVDGKQVFHFGKVPIYLDGNVAYSSINGGDWEATSLQEIVKAATLFGD